MYKLWRHTRRKTLYLHLGFSKTGTSSFQVILKENEDRLRDLGFYYKHTITSPSTRDHSHLHNSVGLRCLYKSMSSNIAKIKNLNDDQVQELELSTIEELGRMSNQSNVIISGETLCQLISNGNIVSLVNFFINSGFRVVPIIVVRSPYSFLCSSYQQRIKGGYGLSLGRDIRPPEWAFQYELKIKPLLTQLTHCEPIKFLPYRKCTEQYKLGTPEALFSYIGIDINKLNISKSSASKNVGRNNKFIRLKNNLNNEQPIFEENGDLNPNRVRLKDIEPVPEDNESFALTKEEFSYIRKDIKYENKMFRDVLGEEFCDISYPFTHRFDP